MSKSMIEESRKEWTAESMTMEAIQLGAILRIADATEKMCVDRIQLESDLKFYEERHKHQQNEIEALRRSKSSYIGKFRQMKEALRIANEEIKRLKGESHALNIHTSINSRAHAGS